MTKNAPPSRNPAGDDTLIGLIRLAYEKQLQQTDDMLPAQVMAYDRPSNRAQVQPLIATVTTDGIQVTRAQVASVPVLQLGGNGLLISFPLKAGNLGWIKANDRDISLFKTGYSNSSPNTQRKHSFEDALFIPDLMHNFTIMDEDLDNAVLQNAAGTVRLALFASMMKFTLPHMSVGDTEGYTPDPNAVLDVQSTTRAFRFPRMSTGQKNAIPNPGIGMTVFDIGLDRLSTYCSGGWT